MKNCLLILSVILTGILTMAISCDKIATVPRTSLVLENRLGKDVYVLHSFNYPDTTLFFVANKDSILKNEIFLPASPVSEIPYRLSLKESPRDFGLDDTLLIFVYDKQELQTKDWQFFASGNNYLRRYKYTVRDIMVDHNFKVVIE